jgi:hypothetical protein
MMLFKLTETQEITPTSGCIRTRRGEPPDLRPLASKANSGSSFDKI